MLRNNSYKPFLMFNCEICFTLITRRRAKALAEQDASAVGALPEPPNSLRDAAPPRERKTLFLSLRSLKRSVNSPRPGARVPAPAPEDVIPTPSEGSELSFCLGDHSSDSENDDSYEEVNPNTLNHTYHNIDLNLENNGRISESEGFDLDTVDHLSLVPSEETVDRFSLVPSEKMNDPPDQVSQLCDAVRAALNTQSASSATKLSVAFPVFRDEECEDVQEFVNNYKPAARSNGWKDSNLALELSLYLNKHASAWLKTSEAPDEMALEDLSAALIKHFASVLVNGV